LEYVSVGPEDIMKAIVAILLLAMTSAALAETQSDQPIKLYKGGKLIIYDTLRQMAPRCPAQSAAESCQAPSAVKPEAEKKPASKGFG
jgi:predicted lipoprotein